MRAEKCRYCDEPRSALFAKDVRCLPHARMDQMRYTARRRGLLEPSIRELEDLVRTSEMKCAGCRLPMAWTFKMSERGRRGVISLQHDRSGALRLLCVRCNIRHSDHPGDTFYEIPEGKRFCGRCQTFRPLDQFPRNRAQPGGIGNPCRKCKADLEMNRDRKAVYARKALRRAAAKRGAPCP